jgi:hypothetical protein
VRLGASVDGLGSRRDDVAVVRSSMPITDAPRS